MFETKMIKCKNVSFPSETDKSLRTFDKEFAVNISASIREQGLIHPIAVYADPANPGYYIGFDGRHRHHAVSKCLKQDLIECKVFTDLDLTEAHMASVAANLWRHNLTPAQYTLSIKVWFDYYAQKNPTKVGGNRASKADREAAQAVAKPAVEAQDGTAEDNGQPTEVAEEATDKNFAETVAATTGQSLASAKRAQRLAVAFEPDQLETFNQMATSKTDMTTIAKIKDKTKRSEVVNLVASGMEPTVAVERIMGDNAPSRDNGNKTKAEKAAAALVAKSETTTALTDAEWFTKECGDKAGLIAFPDKYKSDAILYRQLNEARHVFRGKAKAPLKTAKENKLIGPFQSQVQRLASISHPKDWLLCGTCGGKCVNRPMENPNDLDAQCSKCYGAGYQTKTENYL